MTMRGEEGKKKERKGGKKERAWLDRYACTGWDDENGEFYFLRLKKFSLLISNDLIDGYLIRF